MLLTWCKVSWVLLRFNGNKLDNALHGADADELIGQDGHAVMRLESDPRVRAAVGVHRSLRGGEAGFRISMHALSRPEEDGSLAAPRCPLPPRWLPRAPTLLTLPRSLIAQYRPPSSKKRIACFLDRQLSAMNMPEHAEHPTISFAGLEMTCSTRLGPGPHCPTCHALALLRAPCPGHAAAGLP